MKFKKECKFCENTYDALLTECPKCHEPNPDVDALTTKNISVYPWWKQIMFFGVGWLGFQAIGTVIAFITMIFVDKTTATYYAIVNFLSYMLLFGALVCISIPKFGELFKSFKSYKPYVAGIVGFIAIYAFNITYSIILQVLQIKISDNANESAITSIVTLYPLLSLLVFGIIGPVCEELTYRVGLFTLTRRLARWAAYLITIFIFAFIHFDWGCFNSGDTSIIINELINMPLYLFAGFAMSFIYDRFGLAGSITAHTLNNTVSIALTIVADKLGV